MSEQNVVQFLWAVEGDQELLGRCKTAPDLDVVISIAAEAGYQFTAEDVGATGARLQKAAQGGLSEDELDAVVGGFDVFLGASDPMPFGRVSSSFRGVFGQFGLSPVPLPREDRRF